METCMFLRLLVKNLHESTKTCMFPCFPPFSAHLYPPLHHNGKRSIVHAGKVSQTPSSNGNYKHFRNYYFD